jgi:hypothetical protein
MMPLRVVPAAGLGTLALLAASCGGSSKAPPVASVGTTASTPRPAAAPSIALYASCMRAHGVSNFPDSAISVSDGRVEMDVPRSIKTEAQFAAASKACQRDLPGGGGPAKHADVRQELAFASCMRSHGIKDFPDPLPGGGFDLPGDTSSPRFEAAENACQAPPGSPGVHVNGPPG